MDLDQLLKVYTFPPFGSKAMECFVRKEWEKKGSKAFHEPLIVEIGSSPTAKALKDSLLYRYPVYFGRPMKDFYAKTLVRSSLIEKVDPSVRYVLAGKVVLRNSLSNSSWVFHTWGINLESPTTHDYKTFVDSKGQLKKKKYKKLLTDILGALLYGAMVVCEKEKEKEATMVLPQLGLGAFLSSLSDPRQVDWCISSFLAILTSLADDYPKIKIHYCIYRGVAKTERLKPNLVVHQGCDMFGLLKHLAKVPLLIGVNAWDSKSWIGNGMARDPTIDGFMVAGHGPGKAWQNSSYLHNPLLYFS